MTNGSRALARQALHKSIEVRKQAHLKGWNAVWAFDVCEKLGIDVKFVSDSMEGMYVKGDSPCILLSARRPAVRRHFTCAHELGHHVFGHGTSIDEMIRGSVGRKFDPKEFLANAFAGFLLLPIIGVRKAFAARGWTLAAATPEQVFTVACSFGVGYTTLIKHMFYGLELINNAKASLLVKVRLETIRRTILGYPSSEPLIVADAAWSLPTIDAEVGDLILLPNGTTTTHDMIVQEMDLPRGRLFRAKRPGITRVRCLDAAWAVPMRVSQREFVGLSSRRHQEEVDDE